MEGGIEKPALLCVCSFITGSLGLTSYENHMPGKSGLPHLVDVELLYKVQVRAFPAQMSLSQSFNSLLLQAIHHIVVGVLIREACQSLKREKPCELVSNTSHYRKTEKQADKLILTFQAKPFKQKINCNGAATGRITDLTLLMSVIAYTSSSVSTPSFSSRISMMLDHSFWPAAVKSMCKILGTVNNLQSQLVQVLIHPGRVYP